MKYIFISIMLFAGIDVAHAECPAGYAFNTTLQKCEIAPTCPSGLILHLERDICSMKSSNGKCPIGLTYNSEEKSCEAAVTCPPDTYFDGDLDKCVQK